MKLNSPIHVHWEMTNICNMKCLHCYQKKDTTRTSLNEEALFLIANKLVDARVFQVTLTGGEPFVVPSLPKLVEFFVSNQVNCLITSNGTLVDKAKAKWLAEHKVPVQISLDSHIPEKHNEFRNYSGAYYAAINALKILVENRVKTSLAFCASKLNFMDLEGTIQLAIKLGVKKVLVGEYLPLFGENIGEDVDQLEFSIIEYKEFIKKVVELKKTYQSVIDIQINTEWGFLLDASADHSPCTAMDRDMAILYSGDVTPCPFIRYGKFSSIGSLLSSEVYSIWNSDIANEFRSTKYLGCHSSCVYFDLCKSGCKAIYANRDENINLRDPRCLLFRNLEK